MASNKNKKTRRGFLKAFTRGGCIAAAVGAAGYLSAKSGKAAMVWQLDPEKCTACGNCATYCVLEESAVKCVHTYALCGYCDLCTGYFPADIKTLNTGGENQLCPTGAIKRTYVEDPYFEYTIDESLCIGCGKCVKGCNAFGNGSLYLQVSHDLCLNCNECSIAVACPSQAYKRVPLEAPYILKENEAT